jgi:hypothetical protein
MGDRLHKLGVYFGVADPTPEELAAAESRPSIVRTVFAYVVSGVVVAALYGAVKHDLQSGIEFAVLLTIALIGVRLWERRFPD